MFIKVISGVKLHIGLALPVGNGDGGLDHAIHANLRHGELVGRVDGALDLCQLLLRAGILHLQRFTGFNPRSAAHQRSRVRASTRGSRAIHGGGMNAISPREEEKRGIDETPHSFELNRD